MADRPPWHERPEFWEMVREFVFPPEKVAEAADQADLLWDLLDLDAGANALDVPCGVGRHAVEFASRGVQVTGVDATASYLEAARERARDAGVDVEFVRADMREFSRPSSFDAAYNLYTSFGYFADRADDERTARNVYESLKPGGTFVLDLASKETLAASFEGRSWEERDGTYVLEEREVRDGWNWVENRWVVVDDGDVAEFSIGHRLYSAFEFSALLGRVGFEAVDVYGDFERAPFDQDAERLVVVAQK